MAINVLEHIADDISALRQLSRSLTANGNMVLFVPGYQQLYGEFDRRVGHHRRYTPTTIAATAREAGLVSRRRPSRELPGRVRGGPPYARVVRRPRIRGSLISSTTDSWCR